MAKSTYFVQECPTCGRALHVRVEYIGRALVCQHCNAPVDLFLEMLFRMAF